MGTINVEDHGYKLTDTGRQIQKHTYTPPPVSVPVLSHPVINISAISIIDRWISPHRCTKIIQTFLCWNWSINISPAGCLLRGWKVEGALLCFALLSYCAVEMKKTYFSVCLPVLVIFQFYSLVLILGSVWYIQCSPPLSFCLPFALPSPLPLSFPSTPTCPPLSLWISFIHLGLVQ